MIRSSRGIRPSIKPGAIHIDLILRLTDELNTSTLLVTHDLVHLPRMHGAVHLIDGRFADALTRA